MHGAFIIMVILTCDNCGKEFDEEGKSQCPYCNCPIVEYRLLYKYEGRILKEGIAVFPEGGRYALIESICRKNPLDEFYSKKELDIDWVYRIIPKNKHDSHNPYYTIK